MAKAFIVQFTKVIEAQSPEGWLDLQTKAQREKLIADKAVDVSYSGWSVGTYTVLEELRSAEFRLLQYPDHLRLTFEGVMIPSDPGVTYQIRLKIEDGKLLIDEL